MYTVYVHICPNGKRYYGTTKRDVKKRWLNGYKENKYFTKAIQEFGWDNIQHIVIAKGLTQDEAYWLEEELIKVFDTTNRDKGYNITKGGAGWKGVKHTEDTKKKISEYNIGENNPNYGKQRSEETKKKISENNCRYWEGKHFSEKHKKKMSETKSGKNNPRAKSVICITTKRIFYTLRDGAKYYGIANSCNVSRCCEGKHKYAGKLNNKKLVWRYLVWEHNKIYRVKR